MIERESKNPYLLQNWKHLFSGSFAAPKDFRLLSKKISVPIHGEDGGMSSKLLKLKLTPVTLAKVFLGSGKSYLAISHFRFAKYTQTLFELFTSQYFTEMPKSFSFIYEKHKHIAPHETANAIRECFSAAYSWESLVYATHHSTTQCNGIPFDVYVMAPEWISPTHTLLCCIQWFVHFATISVFYVLLL